METATAPSVERMLNHLVRALVQHPDRVEIVCVRHPHRADGGDRYDVRVARSDFPRVVGRQGRTARALRCLLAAAGGGGTEVVLNLVDPEELEEAGAPPSRQGG